LFEVNFGFYLNFNVYKLPRIIDYNNIHLCYLSVLTLCDYTVVVFLGC